MSNAVLQRDELSLRKSRVSVDLPDSEEWNTITTTWNNSGDKNELPMPVSPTNLSSKRNSSSFFSRGGPNLFRKRSSSAKINRLVLPVSNEVSPRSDPEDLSPTAIIDKSSDGLPFIRPISPLNRSGSTSPISKSSEDPTSPKKKFLELKSNDGSMTFRTSTGTLSNPRTSRSKPPSTQVEVNEALIQHEVKKWKDVKIGCSPRDKIIHNFEVGRSIGKGGSGAKIHECRLPDGGMYAVKIFDPTIMIHADFNKIRHEIHIMELLPYHSSLINYRGHYESSDGKIYIFMNLHNDNLCDYLKNLAEKGKHLTLNQIVKMAIDILTGIEILHECEIMHRDIKSANIFLNYNIDNEVSSLTVGDMDTAKRVVSMDGTKTCIGTPLWTAPEVLDIGKPDQTPYSFPADIWSFGMVLYELMTCKFPYHEVKGQIGFLSRILDGHLPLLEQEHVDRYQPILEIWKSCLQRDPMKRPSADDLITLFKNVLKN